jgi:hypothetical protein
MALFRRPASEVRLPLLAMTLELEEGNPRTEEMAYTSMPEEFEVGT